MVSYAELRACGLGAGAIKARARAGYLHRLHRGVYAVGHPDPPWQGWILAAVKACGREAVASHFSAARLWGFGEEDDDRVPDVTLLGSGGVRHPGVRVHRTASLESRDRLRAQGVPATAPARTLLDVAALTDGAELRSLVRRAQGVRRVSVRQITEIIARRGPCRGSRRLARVVATGPAPTRSVLEDVVLDLLLEAGFEPPDVNVALTIEGRRVIPDFRWPAQRLVLEADGAAWHDSETARRDDAARQALLESAGERVLRVSWAQAVGDRARTGARLRAAGAPRMRGTAPGTA